MKIRFLMLVLGSFCWGCSGSKSEPPEESTSVKPSEIKVSEIVAIGKVEPEGGIVDLAASAGGIVKAVYVKEGDEVQEGDLLVQLNDDADQIGLSDNKIQMQTQRNQVLIEKNKLRENEVKQNARKVQLERYQNLVGSGAATVQDVDDLKTELKTLEIEIESNKVAIAAAESRLSELQNQQRSALLNIKDKKLKAPFAGRLLAMDATEGASLQQYTTYAELAPAGDLIVRAEVDELFNLKLKTGQLVDIRGVGTSTVLSSGEIIWLSPSLKQKSLFSEKAGELEDRRVREVKIRINASEKLIINAKVECVIKI